MVKRRVRKQPQRTCIACQQVLPKRELTRIVREPNGKVTIDPTGKLSGRGTYLCAGKQCWFEALKRKHIERALHVVPTAEEYATLEAFALQLSNIATEET